MFLILFKIDDQFLCSEVPFGEDVIVDVCIGEFDSFVEDVDVSSGPFQVFVLLHLSDEVDAGNESFLWLRFLGSLIAEVFL